MSCGSRLDAADGKELWSVNVLERFEARNITWGIANQCWWTNWSRDASRGGPDGCANMAAIKATALLKSRLTHLVASVGRTHLSAISTCLRRAAESRCASIDSQCTIRTGRRRTSRQPRPLFRRRRPCRHAALATELKISHGGLICVDVCRFKWWRLGPDGSGSTRSQARVASNDHPIDR
jgi:hypothetical protein